MSYEIKVVSLQRRTDRRTYMTELFDGKYTFEFHNAIDGTTLDSNVSASLFIESTFHEWNASVPAMKAISLTNYGIWQESYTQNKNIVIFEDDITIENDKIFDFDTIFNEIDSVISNSSSPLEPLTVTKLPSTETLTPSTIFIGFFATLDIKIPHTKSRRQHF